VFSKIFFVHVLLIITFYRWQREACILYGGLSAY